MYISKLKITSFGGVRGRELTLGRGLNVIEGGNESGKTALAMFIKFLFYGLSGRESAGGISERERFLSWSDGAAAGSAELYIKDKGYRVERVLTHSAVGESSYREVVRTIDLATNSVIARGGCPGERFFGVPEDVFVNTVFIRQSSGARVEGQTTSSAVENLLFSADETAGTSKALVKLDAERKKLLHKNGGGGEIAELEAKRRALYTELDEASARSAEALSLEGSVSELRRRVGETGDKLATLREKADEIETLTSLGLFAKQHAAEAALAAAEAEMTAADGEYSVKPDRDFITELRSESRVCADLDADIRSASLELDSVRVTGRSVTRRDIMKPDDDDDEPMIEDDAPDEGGIFEQTEDELAEMSDSDIRALKRSIDGEVSACESKRRALFSTAAVMFVFGLICCVGGFALRELLEAAAVYALIAAAVFFSAGIVCLSVSAAATSKLNKLFDKWGIPNAAAIDETIDDLVADSRRAHELDAEAGEIEARLEAARVEFAAHADKILTMTAPFTKKRREAGELPTAAELREESRIAEAAAEKYINAHDSLLRGVTAIRARLDALTEQVAGLNERELKEHAASRNYTPGEADGVNAAAVRRELDFTEKALAAQTTRLHDRELRLASVHALGRAPADIAQEITLLEGRIASLRERHDALLLAVASLSEASSRLRAGVAPRLAAAAGASMNALTDGRYSSLGVGSDLTLTFLADGGTRDSAYMSAGTSDAAYLSLRLALADLLFKGEPAALVFDEAFARLDDTRLASVIALLKRRKGQSLVLSCQHREAEIAGSSITL